MTITDTAASSPLVEIDAPPAARPEGRWRFWVGAALACVALVGSGGVRLWQERQVATLLEEGKHSPFPLAEMPLTLGPWRGETAKLDPRVAANTGSVDHIFRRYTNQLTGAAVDVIVLYGPSTQMFIHAPENCYPGAGYLQVEGAGSRVVDIGEGRRAPFRSLVYAKGEAAAGVRQEVYYSWRYLGKWSPNVGTHKEFERIPGMYKVHLAREVSERELREVGNPCESLLEHLMPELERRIEAARPKPGHTAAAS